MVMEKNLRPKEVLELGTKQGLKRRAKFIKSTVGIHDRTQLETIFTFSLEDKTAQAKRLRLKPRYKVDAYFFFPVQLGVNKQSYPRTQFYHDLRAFVRLREPRLNYKQMLGEMRGGVSPYLFVKKFIDKALATPDPKPCGSALEEARAFACSYSSFVLRRVEKKRRKILQMLQVPGDPQDEEVKVELEKTLSGVIPLMEKAYSVLKSWRLLHEQSKTLSDEHYEALKKETAYVNEYCSYSFREALFRLQKIIGERKDLLPANHLEWISHDLATYSRLEHWYAKRANFLWITPQSDLSIKERFIFRTGALKRRVWSVLYLSARPHALFAIQKQIGAMLAAALAAAWALFMSFIIFTRTDFKGFGVAGALSGMSVSLVILAFVSSYILKDRIKEVSRVLFARGLFGTLPDLTNDIVYQNALGKKSKIGRIKESMDFLLFGNLPEDIFNLKKEHTDEILDTEGVSASVVHYSKMITLHGAPLKRFHRPVRAVHDIIRFNIESFLPRLDEPLHKSLVATSSTTSEDILMPKVYHLDLIIKYTPSQADKFNKSIVYDYFRLVLNKKGLTRIELLT